ncbi:MAG: flagellar biosynthesis protein FlhB [SAR86 cluster bacterium]|uniref:Flagellar biosynthetic protein FlhB n=1 Tax=SAR86 cluster bacterium TaxID=2030880 RepID=A0A2A4MK48_9GAMM|nr:MAG: flagellar biosynthesis protein FlhB [SAR86 cluster bacterium]
MAEGNDSAADKTEEPTEKRLQKAREDGDTVRSKELNTTAILMSGAVGLILFGKGLAQSLSSVMSANFDLQREDIFSSDAMMEHLSSSIATGFFSLLPLFIVLLLASIFGPILLGGWNFTFKAIEPKASRMNPMSGLARMFGPKSLMELLKSVAKVVLVASIGMLVLFVDTSSILGIQQQSVIPAMLQSLDLIVWGFLFLTSAMLVLTAIDIPFQIHQHTQKMRMTLQQVKDEMKNTDGRPEVKQKIRQLQQQMASNRMMQDVPEADVIITNPSHYAVALSYDKNSSSAPKMVAKGVDLIALKIREVGSEHKVPIITSPQLARAIYYNTEIGQEIPSGLYVAVAQVLAYIYQLKLYAQGKIKKPVLAKKMKIPNTLMHD